MDGIQPYAAPTPSPRPPAHRGGPHYQVHAHPQHAQAVPNPAAVKTPSDYVRALRRRVWLVLMVAVPLGVASSVYAVRQPSVYRATTQILIKPPQYDPMLAMLVSSEGGRRDADSAVNYLPNRVALLKSKGLAQQVVNDPAFLQAAALARRRRRRRPGQQPPDQDRPEHQLGQRLPRRDRPGADHQAALDPARRLLPADQGRDRQPE